VARIHTNRIAKPTVFTTINTSSINPIEPQNTTAVNKLITKIFAYSAIKIIANNPLLYSVLNPDTSSDSPSAKSNGVRLVSAKHVMNHSAPSGGTAKPIQEC